ncbi:MAG: hypothetical protein HUJ88_11050 [Fusobacterium necrophorum]|nr:hypothetical protein [Fusobacterium necrophorum]
MEKKKKKGRPRVKEEERSIRRISVTFTEEDFQILQKKAKEQKTKPGMIGKKIIKRWLETQRKEKDI